jgi:hypothetical protein
LASLAVRGVGSGGESKAERQEAKEDRERESEKVLVRASIEVVTSAWDEMKTSREHEVMSRCNMDMS